MYKKIASGDLCNVYLLVDGKGSVTSAVKKYKNRKSGVSYAALREINILKEIQHPNLIKIQKITFNDKLSIHLEYGGMTLSYYSEMLGSFDNRRDMLKCISFQLINGVHILHKYGIIHRDIKPDNLFVAIKKYPHLKIGDFGLAKKIRPGNLSPTVCTLNYRSPELLIAKDDSKVKYSYGLDIWSCACSLYEFLFCEDLFDGDDDMGILHDIIRKMCIEKSKIKLSDDISIDYVPKKDSVNYLDKMIDNGDKNLVLFKDMLKKMLEYEQKIRIASSELIKHEFLLNPDKKYSESSNDVQWEIVVVERDKLKIDENERNLAVDHIIEARDKYKTIKKRTVLVAIDIFDMYCMQTAVKSVDSLFIAYVCLYISSKFNDIDMLGMDVLEEYYKKNRILDYEKDILIKTNFTLRTVTLLDIYKHIKAENPNIRNKNSWNIICKLISNYKEIKNKKYGDVRKKLLEKLSI